MVFDNSKLVHPTTVTVNALHPSVKVWRGFSFAETASSAAYVRFRKGSATGDVAVHLKLAADESATIVVTKDNALEMDTGVYVEVVSGTVAGTLYS